MHFWLGSTLGCLRGSVSQSTYLPFLVLGRPRGCAGRMGLSVTRCRRDSLIWRVRLELLRFLGWANYILQRGHLLRRTGALVGVRKDWVDIWVLWYFIVWFPLFGWIVEFQELKRQPLHYFLFVLRLIEEGQRRVRETEEIFFIFKKVLNVLLYLVVWIFMRTVKYLC